MLIFGGKFNKQCLNGNDALFPNLLKGAIHQIFPESNLFDFKKNSPGIDPLSPPQ
jgi:hypothetical protein